MTVRIVCVHLLDDFSGASNVCAQAIDAMKSAGHDVRVIVGGGAPGFVRRSHTAQRLGYRYSVSTTLRLARFALAQAAMFARVASSCWWWKAELVYASTLLPAGAMLAGVLCRRRVVTHVHEVGLGSARLFVIVRACALRWSDVIVCVSEFVERTLQVPPRQARVVHNSLDVTSWARAAQIAIARQASAPAEARPFQIAMACSLKRHKGIDSLFALAAVFEADSSVAFTLALNCDEEELARFLQTQPLPRNLRIERRPASVLDMFARSHLVLNLSHSDSCVETFGLTLLEAMACGVPVVSPVVGGCVEVVRHGHGGWRIDSRDIAALATRVCQLNDDRTAWRAAADSARRSAQDFEPSLFRQRLLDALPAPR